MNRQATYFTLTIPSGETTSDPLEVDDFRLLGLILPDELDGTGIGVEVSHDSASWVPAERSMGGPGHITFGIESSELPRAYSLYRQLTVYPFIRFVANASQSVDRELVVCCKN